MKAASVLLIAVIAVAGVISQAEQRVGETSFDEMSKAAERAFNEARDDDVIRLAGLALAKKPEWEEGLWYLGASLYQKQQYAEARDVLRRFMTLRPDAGPGWALLGLSEFNVREYSRALQHLQRAMSSGMGERSELTQPVFYDVAILLTRFERYDDSMDMLVRMLSNSPLDDSLTVALGLAGLRLPLLPSEVAANRRQVIQLAGSAVAAVQTARSDDATAKLKQLTTTFPNEPGVHFLYGAYLMPSDPGSGVSEMRRELEVSPSHALARVRLADQFIAEQKYDEALDLAKQAIELDPDRASAHMLAGEALLAKGDSEHGIAELEKARDRDPSSSKTHWDLLRAYVACGQREKADREKQEIEKRAAESGSNHVQE